MRGGRHLGAAGDDDVGIAVLDASAWPRPMACVDVVHAVTTPRFGPRSPKRIDRCPETMLMIVLGHEERRDLARVVAPRDTRCALPRCVSRPPMPEPMMTPAAVEVDLGEIEARVGHRLHARGDAVVHELVHAPGFLRRRVVVERRSRRPRRRSGTGKARDIEAGDRRDAAHAVDDVLPRRSSRLLPTGETMPSPVTTTRRLRHPAAHAARRSQDLRRSLM